MAALYTNYRRVSISSNVGKLFARLIANRINKFVESNQILGEMQAGFRKGRGTQDNIFILSQLINHAKNTKKTLASIKKQSLRGRT